MSDEPVYDEIGRTVRRAKREHRCTLCGQSIAPGMFYLRIAYREDSGPPQTMKWHHIPRCDWRAENGDPFDYKRDRRRDDRDIHKIGEDER